MVESYMITAIAYFHSNRRIFCSGAVVDPGSYGRIVIQNGESGAHWARETVLESVRSEQFPAKPSRLSSCFATDNIDTALFYHRHHCLEGYLYAIEIDDPSQPIHIGDFNCIQPIPGRTDTMEQIAEYYWSGSLRTNIAGHPGLVCDEVVTASRLRIISRIYVPEDFRE